MQHPFVVPVEGMKRICTPRTLTAEPVYEIPSCSAIIGEKPVSESGERIESHQPFGGGTARQDFEGALVLFVFAGTVVQVLAQSLCQGRAKGLRGNDFFAVRRGRYRFRRRGIEGQRRLVAVRVTSAGGRPAKVHPQNRCGEEADQDAHSVLSKWFFRRMGRI